MSKKNDNFKFVDAKFLPKAWQKQVPEDIELKFFRNGQLKLLCYEDLKLELKNNKTEGSMTYGKSGYSIYNVSGTSESVNPWSDNEEPKPTDWEEWVKDCINWIYKYWCSKN
ncbi:MAG: hypothetical protein KDD58_05405 [Bdellovibrionales bacterium]|nr:hypothetical protein [Bdellovibrionales bacterium]